MKNVLLCPNTFVHDYSYGCTAVTAASVVLAIVNLGLELFDNVCRHCENSNVSITNVSILLIATCCVRKLTVNQSFIINFERKIKVLIISNPDFCFRFRFDN